MANCNPPYARGTGGFCGCNCKCCPPDHCTGQIKWIFVLAPPQNCPDCNGCCPDGIIYVRPSSSSSGVCHCDPCPTSWTLVLTGFDQSCSSSSSSSVDCSCFASIILTFQCSIEVTGGHAYSIGTQIISYVATDICGALASVQINGVTPPVLVLDGQEIIVTVAFNSGFTLCQSSGPVCTALNFAFVRKGNKKIKIKITGPLAKRIVERKKAISAARQRK